MIPLAVTFVSNTFFVLMLMLASPSLLSGQSQKCSDQDLLAILPPTDRVYSMAADLADTLLAEDFIIKCVLRSKSEGMFRELHGAALFRTNRGDFDAMFLPKQKTFEKLKVLERQEGGKYIYSFEGEPKPWPANRIESPQRIYFVKHAHLLLMLPNDVLAEDLRRAISKQQ